MATSCTSIHVRGILCTDLLTTEEHSMVCTGSSSHTWTLYIAVILQNACRDYTDSDVNV